MDQFNKSTNENHLYMKFLRYKVVPNSEILCWIVQFNKSTAKKPPIYGIFEMRKQSFFLPIQQLNKEFTHPRSKNLRQDKINKSTAKKHLYMKFLSWLNRFFFQFNKSTRNSPTPDWHLQILGSEAQFNKSMEEKNIYIWNFWGGEI